MSALLLVGQVGGHHTDLLRGHALFQQQGAGLVQLPFGAREQDYADAGAAQSECDSAADAAPGPGY
jgi:hypothetical protein